MFFDICEAVNRWFVVTLCYFSFLLVVIIIFLNPFVNSLRYLCQSDIFTSVNNVTRPVTCSRGSLEGKERGSTKVS